ncbi:phophatidylserine decarboxylase associated domain-containing protein [Dickeya ananatis]
MTHTKSHTASTPETEQSPHYESSGHSLLTLDNAGPIQMGFWVPNRVWATAKFLMPLREHIANKKQTNTLAPMQPVLQNFKNWVTNNSVYRMWLNSMIEQSNAYVASLPESTRKEISDDGDATWIDSYDSFFEILNEIITTSPSFNTTAQVGTPMNAFFGRGDGNRSGRGLVPRRDVQSAVPSGAGCLEQFPEKQCLTR